MTIYYHNDPSSFYDTAVHAAESIPKGAVKVTARQKQELLDGERAGMIIVMADGKPALADPEPDLEAPARAERGWRDVQLASVEWIRDRHRDELELGRETSISAEQFVELLTYMQALRDWPAADEFPSKQARPVAPEWISA